MDELTIPEGTCISPKSMLTPRAPFPSNGTALNSSQPTSMLTPRAPLPCIGTLDKNEPENKSLNDETTASTAHTAKEMKMRTSLHLHQSYQKANLDQARVGRRLAELHSAKPQDPGPSHGS